MNSKEVMFMNIKDFKSSTRRRWLALIAILIPVFIGALDLTIVSAILPDVLTRLHIALDTNLQLGTWMVTGYLLAYTLSMIVMGRVSDLVGRRTTYLLCLGIFIVGSWWVATVQDFPVALLNLIARQALHQRPNLNQLTLVAIIVGRVIQAFGAGAIVPVSMALVGDLFPAERRALPVGLIAMFDTLGWVLGHLYGGLMVDFFSQHGQDIEVALKHIGLSWPAPDWRTLFFLNIPVGLAALGLTWWALRGFAPQRNPGKFDLVGALLISLTLIGLTLGLGSGADISSPPGSIMATLPFNLPLVGGAIVCLSLFLVAEQRNRDPLLPLHLLRKPNVLSALATNGIVGFGLMLGLGSVPLFVNLRAGADSAASVARVAQQSGILLSTLTIPLALAAMPGGWLANRIGSRVTTVLGLSLALSGFLLASLTWQADTSDLWVALDMALIGVGLGLTVSPIGTIVINAADESKRGVTSALVIVLRLLGMTVAMSSLTTYALNRAAFLANTTQHSLPANLTPEQLQQQSLAAYLSASFHVVNELLLIGAIACLLALIPAILIQRSRRIQSANADRLLGERASSIGQLL